MFWNVFMKKSNILTNYQIVIWEILGISLNRFGIIVTCRDAFMTK